MAKNKELSLWPLWVQIMAALIVSMLVVAVCASVLQYHTETQSLQSLLERQNKKNFQLLSAAIIEPIVSEDLPVLQEFVDLLAQQDHDLFSINIYNADGNELLNWKRSSQLPEKPLMTFNNDIVLAGQVFGALTVSWSVDHFYALIEQKIINTQFFLASALLSLTLIVMVLVVKLVVIPIRKINRKVSFYLSSDRAFNDKNKFTARELSELDLSVAILGQVFRKQLTVENELRRTKQEIETLSKRNELILSSAGEGVFVIDTQGKVIFVNPAATEMTGWTSENLVGQGLCCLLQPTKSQELECVNTCHDCAVLKSLPNRVESCQIYVGFMKGEAHHVNNELFWHKNGHSFAVDYVSTPIVENEHLSGTVIVFKDISERLKAEQQVNDSEALKQAMLASSLDAIITVDQAGCICEFNGVAENIFLQKREAVLGRKMVDIIVPSQFRAAHNKGFANYSSSALSKMVRQRIEVSAVRATGEEFPIELVITPITLHEKLFFTAFIRDITEQQRIKDTIEFARIEAEKSNLAKSQFLAAMSHEIRTPLNAMIGINDLLKSTTLNSEQLGYVQIAEKSGFALREIISDILDFSKIEAGKLELEFQQTDLVALIDSVVAIMAPKALEQGLELLTVVEYPIPKMVLIDPVRIKQVLLNLVSNAIKFTEQGWVEIALKRQLNEQGESLLFTVTDTGIGISEDVQSILFNEFTQADLTITRKYGGTGLGLAIASRLVDMSGGKMWVNSKQGEGSCFGFCLRPEYQALTQPELVDLSCWVFDRDTKGEKSAEALNKQLEPLAKHVQLVASWQDILLTGSPSLIFLDETQLAYFSHVEVKQFVADKPSHCLMVLVTGNMQKQLSDDWLDVFDQRILKPILVKELESFLLSCMVFFNGGYKEVFFAEPINEIAAFSGIDLRILLVDDSVVNQLVVKSMLKKAGAHVDIVSDGFIATEQVKKQQYDLILMDLSMPVMGGVEAAQLIRSREGLNQNTPIVALTANAFKDNREQCYQVGMAGFLAKPITMSMLYGEIKKHLGRQSLAIKEKKAESDIELKTIDEQVIDIAVLEQLKGETSALVFPQLIKVFLTQGEQRVATIEKAMNDHDFEKLESEIHALKSESATFGTMKLAETTKQINLLCKQGLKIQAFDEARVIKDQWENVATQLAKYF
ncbi:MAG: PAS domain S-box protein [Methylococcales bacterium]|nr:PAS domain S-box protein [Methylococcales bacterium]